MKKKDKNFSFLESNKETIERIKTDLLKMDDELTYVDADEKVFNSHLIDFSYRMNNLFTSVFNDYRSQIDAENILSFKEINPVACEIKQESGEIYIRFNCLPSRRTPKVSDSNKINADFFRKALETAIIESGVQHRISDAVIIYTVHYNKKKSTDLDNYDLKILTDSICAHFLYDDSLESLMQLLRGEPSDGNPYLDVTVVSLEHFKNLCKFYL